MPSPEASIHNILYLEDDPGMARLLQKRLTRSGYRVETARDAKTGLSLLHAREYDLLILDHRLPGLTGLEVLQVLSADGHMPPTVILTGAGDEKTAVTAMKLGASDYIIKDVEGGFLDLMPSVVERALGQKRLLEEKRAAEDRLRLAHEALEQKVHERTVALRSANEALQTEIAERKLAERRLQEAHRELERLVRERTRDLEVKTNRLEEMNVALNVLLQKREEDQKELGEAVLSNVKKFILPCMEKLKRVSRDSNVIAYLDLLESHVRDIVSPFSKTLSSRYDDLTPTEIRVAELIRQDRLTKEIAGMLHISDSAIVFHRNNIRKKLGLVNLKTSLKSYLQSLA